MKTKCILKSKKYYYHRQAYIKAYGEIPAGMCVRHLCHNPYCANVEHLVLGTHQDNMNDMVEAGRQSKGVNVHTSKLTNSIVKEIQIAKGKQPATTLAKKYKVHRTTIYRIWRKEAWRHI